MGRNDRIVAAPAGGGLDWGHPEPLERGGVKRATYDDVLNAPENVVAENLGRRAGPQPASGRPRHTRCPFAGVVSSPPATPEPASSRRTWWS